MLNQKYKRIMLLGLEKFIKIAHTSVKRCRYAGLSRSRWISWRT